MKQIHAVDLPKVMDIAHPANVQVSTTSRPVLITNRPVIAEDPMIARTYDNTDNTDNTDNSARITGAPPMPGKTAETLIAHQTKHIEPMHDDIDTIVAEETVQTNDEHTQKEDVSLDMHDTPRHDRFAKNSIDEHSSEKTGSSSSEDQIAVFPEKNTAQLDKDTEPNINTTVDARQQEIETIIAKGTYAISIHTARRRFGWLLGSLIVVLLLGVLAGDLILDMGLITVKGLPHTTFFTDNTLF